MTYRTAPLPPGWARIRAAVLERDGHRCTWRDDGVRCIEAATDVDHIGDPNDHRPANLRSLCGWHHDRRTAQQAAAARARLPKMARPAERHPGLV